MSNRKKVVDQETGEVKKVYVPREERRAKRAAAREAAGAPPERRVGPAGASYLGMVEPYDPDTGEALGPPAPASRGGSNAFLLDGVKHVYEGLGGHAGFYDWAARNQTKFRELSMKLVPSQVTIQSQGLGETMTVIHALAPPGYDPHKTREAAIAEVDVEAVRAALEAMDEDTRNELIRQLK